MPRLALLLITTMLAIGLANAPSARSQTGQPATVGQADPATKAKKGLTQEQREQAKEERKAAKQKMREEKKAAKKAKRQDCRAQGKQNNLRGKALNEFVKTCAAG
jgi:uncharacterized membrane protein